MSSFFPSLHDRPLGVQTDSNGTLVTQTPSNFYTKLLPSIQLSHSSRQIDSFQTLEGSNSPRKPTFNLSLHNLNNSPRNNFEINEIANKNRRSLQESHILTVIEKQTAAIEKLTERIERDAKSEQKISEENLSQSSIKLRKSLFLARDQSGQMSSSEKSNEQSPLYPVHTNSHKRKSILKKITNEAALQSLIKLQMENKLNKLNRVTFAEEASTLKLDDSIELSDDEREPKKSLVKIRSEPLINLNVTNKGNTQEKPLESREMRFLKARRPQINFSSSEDSSAKVSESESEQQNDSSNFSFFVYI